MKTQLKVLPARVPQGIVTRSDLLQNSNQSWLMRMRPIVRLSGNQQLASHLSSPCLTSAILGVVGHCFAWHVRVSFGFYFNFETEELVHSGLCVMQLGHNRIFPADRIRILPQKINRLLLHF
jgi:hypothetical protein